MKNYIYLLVLTLLCFNCSPNEDDGFIPNNPPTNFSTNTIETTYNSGTIIWTESNDQDDDIVTYSIILEGEEIASGITDLTYTFTGLEAETVYNGYVEARDGRGGTSQAEFSILTDPQVIEFSIDASYWERSRAPEAGGERVVFQAGFEVPYYEDATLYQIEIVNFQIDGTNIDSAAGQIYTWTNENYNEPVYFYEFSEFFYGVALRFASVNTISDQFANILASYQATAGEAIVTIQLGE